MSSCARSAAVRAMAAPFPIHMIVEMSNYRFPKIKYNLLYIGKPNNL